MQFDPALAKTAKKRKRLSILIVMHLISASIRKHFATPFGSRLER